MDISTQGYDNLRNYIQSNWKYIELQSSAGTSVIRLTNTDSRVTITNSNGKITYVLVLKGSDVPVGTEVAKSAIFNVASGGTAFSTETFTSFTFAGTQDEL
ncbi:hypothetical protein A2U94_17855 [Bacillus sp. VT 712]|uniref:hypothetical protein n=1 Tax=Bacillaceae TaxID=186817 RepID=UPI000473A97D|nr:MULTISPECIES: hypothetical protein [Bacillaceae]KZB90119.1 hypothetical protein A2U94_17855 [Bacillus sp. VT 712]